MAISSFKVIIVGGSVTGLTLAHSLDSIGVDYVVLEKRHEVAPQEGASIGILPNGARVLDQLGLYDAIEKTTAPLGVSHIYFPDGFHFPSPYPKKMQSHFGYPIAFMERQKLLAILYSALPDKSKVRVNTTVSRIEQPAGEGVRVQTVGGEVYHADLVVGADGVHSSIRSQLWEATNSSEIDRMSVEFSCIFGMSSGAPELEPGEQFMRINDGWTLVVIPSINDVVFWFIVRKLDRRCGYADAPRYTKEDAIAACEQYADVPVWKGIRFGDIWEKRTTFNMTALQESVFQTWSHGRVVCVGDSIHKMTVNLGQGANCAIEDVAVLTNILNGALQEKAGGRLSDDEMNDLLRRFNKSHLSRVSQICNASWMTARIHARDGFLPKMIGRYGMPFLGALFEGRPFNMIADAATLDFLPLPRSYFTGWKRYKSKQGKGVLSWLIAGSGPLLIAAWWTFSQ